MNSHNLPPLLHNLIAFRDVRSDQSRTGSIRLSRASPSLPQSLNFPPNISLPNHKSRFNPNGPSSRNKNRWKERLGSSHPFYSAWGANGVAKFLVCGGWLELVADGIRSGDGRGGGGWWDLRWR